jgi:hypothetical protein
MPNSLMLAALSGLMVLDTLACMWIGWRGRRFLATTPALETGSDLARFRRLIHHCMYASLVFLILCLTSISMPIVLLALDGIRLTDLNSVVVTGGLRILVAAAVTVSVEGRLKAIPTADPVLAAERDALVWMWDQQMLPTAVPRQQDDLRTDISRNPS